jgi:hypothetical protein
MIQSHTVKHATPEIRHGYASFLRVLGCVMVILLFTYPWEYSEGALLVECYLCRYFTSCWKILFSRMDDFEDLLLSGDIDGVNEVLARTGALNIAFSGGHDEESMVSSTVDNISIPEDVYPKVGTSFTVYLLLSLKTL